MRRTRLLLVLLLAAGALLFAWARSGPEAPPEPAPRADARAPAPVTGEDVPGPEGTTPSPSGEEAPSQTLDVIEGEDPVVRVEPSRATTLVIVAAATSAPLAGARVWTGGSIGYPHVGRAGLVHAMPSARALRNAPRVADASGRIDLGRGKGMETVFVLAEGHAWAAYRVPFVDGDVTLSVLPGGGIDLRIPRHSEIRSLRLRLHPEDGEGGIEISPVVERDDVIRLRGLLAGEWRVEVADATDAVVGQGEAVVLAGRVIPLAIDVEPTEDRRVAVEGTILVPGDWERALGPVTLERRTGKRESRPVIVTTRWIDDDEEDDETVAFGPLRVEPGRYLLEVQPFQWRRFLDVPPGGARFDLVLPGPGRLRVRVVDGVSGADLEEAEVAWSAETAGVSRYHLEEARRDDAPRRFLFAAPPGRVALDVQAPGYLSEYPGHVVAEGKTEDVTVRLFRGATIRVRFTLDGRSFPATGWRVIYSAQDGSQGGGSRGGSDAVSIDDLRAGRYRIRVPAVAGFHPIEPRTVEVGVAETVDVMIVLERE